MARPSRSMLTSSRISTRSILASMTKKFSSAAFDVLAVGGKDLRKLPLSMRKMNLEQQLLARRPEGVFINPFERNRPRFLRLLPSRIDIHLPGRLGDIESPRNNLVGIFLDPTA